MAGCSPSPDVDCPRAPPPPDTPTDQAAEPVADEPAVAELGEPEALTVTADDGHALRLWALLPTTERPEPKRSIVLVHGRTWSSLPDFDLRIADDPSPSLMRALAREGFAVYALDLRGYGQTERDPSGWLEPDRAAEDLFAALTFVAEREGHPPDLLGWSMGALVAQLTVQRHGPAARSLILYGYPRDLDKRTAPESQTGEPPKQANTEAAARSDFITAGTISDAGIDAFVKAALAADPVKVDWRAMHQFDALDAAEIGVPTLVIHGVHDPIAKQLFQAKLFTRMTVEDRQWVVMPNADHAAHLEHPRRFVAAVLAFLRG